MVSLELAHTEGKMLILVLVASVVDAENPVTMSVKLLIFLTSGSDPLSVTDTWAGTRSENTT